MWWKQNKILLSLKIELNSDACYNVDNIEYIMLNKISHTKVQILYYSFYMSYLK